MTTFRQDLTSVPFWTISLLMHSNFLAQITQIDADHITIGPGLYLRYLRHLRAKWDG
jgi:hypothetical protein